MKELVFAKLKPAATLLCAVVVLCSGGAIFPRLVAAEPDRDDRVERAGPLAALPSQPGAHLEKINALGDNEWLNRGSPAPDPKWGQGLGRGWSPKMPYAPELQGAFLNGTGVHGAHLPDGRYTDDIFFYDVNAHRWIAIYPGTNSETLVEKIKKGELKANNDGQLEDNQGQPIPFAAIPHHSYYTHTYDTDLHQYVTYWGNPGIGGDQYTMQASNPAGLKEPYKEARRLLEEQFQGKVDRVKGTPFFFNSLTGKFARYPSDGLKPATGFSLLLFYLPTQNVLWSHLGNQTCTYDCTTHQWARLATKGTPPPGGDFAACYDSQRDRIYVFGGIYRGPWKEDEGKVAIHDVKTSSWSNVPDKGTVPSEGSNFSANHACVHYDTANDTVVVFVHGGQPGPSGIGTYVFDPGAQTWRAEALAIPAAARKKCWSGFYCPSVNAHYFYAANDSRDNGAMWVSAATADEIARPNTATAKAAGKALKPSGIRWRNIMGKSWDLNRAIHCTVAAASALGSIGPAAESAIPALQRKAAQHEYEMLQVASQLAIKNIWAGRRVTPP